jgi:hypothetical protein
MQIRVGYFGAPAQYLDKGGQWHGLRMALEGAGLGLLPVSETTQQGEDWFLAFQHDDQALEAAKKTPRDQRILVVWEPRIVDPRYYKDSNVANYGHRLAMSPLWADMIEGDQVYWPQEAFGAVDFSAGTWLLRSNRVVFINANKTSVLSGERYTLRRQVIDLSERKGIPLDLYGPGWDSPLTDRYTHWAHCMAIALKSHEAINVQSLRKISIRPKSWGGKVAEKKPIFYESRVALAIENSDDFVSEKLFDAVGSGCLTVYVGPNILSEFGIEIDARLVCDPNPTSIVRKIQWALNLPPKTQVELARQQFEALEAIAQARERTYIMKNLGATIAARIKQQN